jgi:hypothetical protein
LANDLRVLGEHHQARLLDEDTLNRRGLVAMMIVSLA